MTFLIPLQTAMRMSIFPSYEGEYKYRYWTGTLSRIECWREGKREGTWKWWHNNGRPRMQICYQDGITEGEYKVWNPSGILAAHFYIRGDQSIDCHFNRKKKLTFTKLKKLFVSNFPFPNKFLISDLEKTLYHS